MGRRKLFLRSAAATIFILFCINVFHQHFYISDFLFPAAETTHLRTHRRVRKEVFPKFNRTFPDPSSEWSPKVISSHLETSDADNTTSLVADLASCSACNNITNFESLAANDGTYTFCSCCSLGCSKVAPLCEILGYCRCTCIWARWCENHPSGGPWNDESPRLLHQYNKKRAFLIRERRSEERQILERISLIRKGIIEDDPVLDP